LFWWFVLLNLLPPLGAGHAAAAAGPAPNLTLSGERTPAVESFRRLAPPTQWNLVRETELGFRTYHPQGLLKIGDRFLLSSVEVFTPKGNRSQGIPGPRSGIGHLFLLDRDGRLLHDLTLVEGACFHPGGIDSDGKFAWIPVAEYRPDSTTVIYRLDLGSLELDEAFRVDDHIGGLAIDRSRSRIHGVSWGSRRLYTWDLAGHLVGKGPNRSSYIDYQDCKNGGPGLAVCSGLNSFPGPNGDKFTLGGLEVIDLESGETQVQIPVPLFARDGSIMTQNPFDYELDGDSVRLYFVPEDEHSVLYEWAAPVVMQ
jgi:hypothetical protein